MIHRISGNSSDRSICGGCRCLDIGYHKVMILIYGLLDCTEFVWLKQVHGGQYWKCFGNHFRGDVCFFVPKMLVAVFSCHYYEYRFTFMVSAVSRDALALRDRLRRVH